MRALITALVEMSESTKVLCAALIQLMACAQVPRDVCYFTFGDEKLRESLTNMYTFLCSMNVTVGMSFLAARNP